MGTISTGTGLISGIDIQGIVEQYMSIEARPRNLLETRMEDLSAQQEALMKVQAQVMALQVSAVNFNKASVFQQKSAVSSNEDVLKVTSSRFAALGQYQFMVDRLAVSDHLVSRGYSSRTSSVGSGQLTFEVGQGQLGRITELGMINGGQGFARGTIRITDGSNNSSEIDLSSALTIEDVLKAINSADGISVTASVSGDRLVLEDTSGGGGTLSVQDVGTSQTATSLGLAGVGVTTNGTKLRGADIVSINTETQLSMLNDGNGVRGLDSGLDIQFTLRDGSQFSVDFRSTMQEMVGDDSQSNRLAALNHGAGVREGTFRITDRNGISVDINTADLGVGATVAQLRTHIEEQAAAKGMDIDVSFNSQDHLTIKDNSEGFEGSDRNSDFIIEDINGGSAASDLGIVGETSNSTITGDQVWFMETLGDITSAINNHWNNLGDLQVDINDTGTGLKATDTSSLFGGELIIDGLDSSAAEDLGLLGQESNGGVIEGRRLMAGLNTVLLRSLNGGNGGSNQIVQGGTISLTDRAGNTAENVDLTKSETVQDVLDAINSAGTNIRASLNSVGNGIVLTDSTASGDVVGNMIVADVGDSTLAAQLGLTVNDAVSTYDSGNLQLQYISEATNLDDMRWGEGIRRGTFEITDGNGKKATVNLNNDGVQTLGDLIDRINSKGLAIRAKINETGDGLMIVDDGSTGNLGIKVNDVNGYSAQDLNIQGTAKYGENFIDGSYEFRLDVGGGDNLEEIMERINDANMGVTASLINDGSSTNPYRLSLSSTISGRVGRVYFDGGDTSLTTQVLARGQDAVVRYGGGEGGGQLVMSSSSNTLDNAIKGVTIDLVSASDKPVTVEVTDDIDSITTAVQNFVDSYNDAMKLISEYDYFDSSTMDRGELFGDSTLSTIKRTLQNVVQRFVANSGAFNRLTDIGVKYSSFGTESGTNEAGEATNYAVVTTPRLTFNADTFREKYSADPDSVMELFTAADTGVGDYIADALNNVAGMNDSTVSRRVNAMTNQKTLFQSRISYLDEILESKEARLYSQFYAMEEALASMQSQQSALAGLSNAATAAKG